MARHDPTSVDVRTVITFVVLLAWSLTQAALLWLTIPTELQAGNTVPSIMAEAKKIVAAVNILPAPVVAYYFGSAVREHAEFRWKHASIFILLMVSVGAACAIVLFRLRAANVGSAAMSQALEMLAWLSPNLTIPLVCFFANSQHKQARSKA